MTSRKPPSQRDAKYALQRLNRTTKSMIPGTVNGLIANASPIEGNAYASVASFIAATTTTVSSTDPQDGTTPAPAPTMPPTSVNTASTPTLDNTTFFQLLQAFWDGNDSSGSVIPTSSFGRIDVYASTSGASFTPAAANYVGSIMAAGGGVCPVPASVATPTYVKFVAVSSSGAAASPSTAASATARQAVDTDAITAFVTNRLMGVDAVAQANIQDAAIGSAEIIDLAVVNAKIGNLAVNDAKIANLTVGKLRAGVLIADISVSSRIITTSFATTGAAATGAYAEMNTNGFFHYNSSGQEDFGADSSGVRSNGLAIAGNASITGITTITGTLTTSTYPKPSIVVGPKTSIGDVIRWIVPTSITVAGSGPSSGKKPAAYIQVEQTTDGATISASPNTNSLAFVVQPAVSGSSTGGTYGYSTSTISMTTSTSDGNTPGAIVLNSDTVIINGYSALQGNAGQTTVTTDASGMATITHNLGSASHTISVISNFAAATAYYLVSRTSNTSVVQMRRVDTNTLIANASVTLFYTVTPI